MISKCINYQSSSSREPPIMALLNANHCSEEFLKLYLSLGSNNNCVVDLSLSVSGVGGASGINCIQCCKKKQQAEWESLLIDYAKKTNQKFSA